LTDFKKRYRLKACISDSWEFISDLRDTICRIESHSVACMPQVNTSRLNHRRMEGWVDQGGWLYTKTV